MEIKKTNDLEQFKFLKGNRPINTVHVNKIAVALAERNLLHLNPILVNKEMYVLDGQHRLLAAKQNNLPIYYIMADEDDLGVAEVQKLNSKTKNWSFTDYVQSYITQGNKDYERLVQFAKDYGTTVSIAASALGGKLSDFASKEMSKIKTGEWKIKAFNEASEIFDYMLDLDPYIEPKSAKNRFMVNTVARIIKNKDINKKKLFEKISKHPNTIKRQINTRLTLEQFEKVYNKGEAKTVRFY